MPATRVVVSLLHFVLMVLMCGFVIYWTYRTFIRANPDFDMEEEITKGNVAVGVLVGTILYCASQILMAGTDSSVQMLRMHMLAPTEQNASVLGLLGRMAGHLAISMGLAVVSISLTLRLFGRLTRRMHAGKELQKGNLAVGILLSSVVLVSSIYIKDGVSSLMKALTPQPSFGQIEIVK
ncbi:MAG TPA: hypothetical protein VH309_08815 [Elusimicrobiota bacterium]|jgi:uncharacterized membrane protein YjfL (UPF0719 family)|nr:hypothetical protein [Elusimicrobiota bacterium]